VEGFCLKIIADHSLAQLDVQTKVGRKRNAYIALCTAARDGKTRNVQSIKNRTSNTVEVTFKSSEINNRTTTAVGSIKRTRKCKPHHCRTDRTRKTHIIVIDTLNNWSKNFDGRKAASQEMDFSQEPM